MLNSKSRTMDNKPVHIPTTVGELMTENLETINLLNTAQEAAMKMTNKNISSLAVVDDDGKAFGIVTERDLARRICITNQSSDNVTVEEIMSSPVITIKPDYSIETAARYMVQKRVRHLLVTDEVNQPVGIITATDFTAYLKENEENDEIYKVIRQVLREHARYE
jgi:CBS domain-containing protein